MREAIEVVAALLWKEGRLLICQRSRNAAFPGQWEFPGGKREASETPAEALVRELAEELGIRARIGRRLDRIEHHYPEGPRVHLLLYEVLGYDGEVANRVFEQIRWVLPEELAQFDFLEADRPWIERLVHSQPWPQEEIS
ncbi:MAG TPA: (deoxy)nucleoside triphosphate pyrophosphohydrolase [Terriglobia bacterium]|nr:(deoxy)nucleoside triphosphate pyrophosphohydrolase [Terriglobia bacterium]